MDTNNWGMQLAEYKVAYLHGIPIRSKPAGGVMLCLYQQGFLFKSRKLNNLFIYHNNIRSFDIIKGAGRFSGAWVDAFFDAHNIRIYIGGQNDIKHIIELEMFESSNPQKNAAKCQELVMIMKSNNIFDKFIDLTHPVPQSNELMSQIEKLAQLHKSGALTDEEFQKMKDELFKHI